MWYGICDIFVMVGCDIRFFFWVCGFGFDVLGFMFMMYIVVEDCSDEESRVLVLFVLFFF